MAILNRRDLLILALSLGAAEILNPVSALAQAKYPDRPIRLIVPFAPGGVADVVARLWADKMASLLGTVVIENSGGASGMIGAAEVARSEPDGYTILLGNTSTQVLNPAITSNPPYDAVKDFTAIGIIASSPISIAVHPSVPAKNLPDHRGFHMPAGGDDQHITRFYLVQSVEHGAKIRRLTQGRHGPAKTPRLLARRSG